MQDNYESEVTVRAGEPWALPVESPCTRTFNASDPCFVQWSTNGTGPYSLFGGTMTSTWRSSVSWDLDADLCFLSVASFSEFGFYPGFSNRTGHPNGWATSIVKMQTANPAGTVKLRSTDPRIAPEIQFNFFEDESEKDLQALAEGVELFLRVFDNTGISYEVMKPEPHVEMKQAIMDDVFSHHATSTCRMGPRGSREHCVDSKFRVNGVNSLRVVDASVFPRVPGAMPNGPTFTISRKAFETIMEDA